MLPVLRIPGSLARCPRCDGTLCRSEDGDRTCMICGEYVYATPPLIMGVPNGSESHPVPRKRGRPRKVRIVA
jgi:hypothetical protein